jgi:NAD(P)-dependent dehydrogenase (short-subunit alcohol dehydrogenase family)
MSLTGRTALITGASQGLGATIAEHFLAEGANVALCGRNAGDLDAQQQRLAAAYGADRVWAKPADVSNRGDVDALFDEAQSRFGQLNVLVANAGVYGPMGSIDAVDWDEWVQAISINLTGTVYCTRKAVETFKPQRYGKILILSGGGATNPLPGISAYAASKAAIVRFTETLALEMREWNIDVNAIAPGALMTRLTDQLIAAGPERVGAALHARMVKLKQEGGTPHSVGASLCGYLASSESDGLTGRLISAPWDPWPFSEDHRRQIAESDIYTLRRVVPKDRGKTWGDR